MTGNDIYCDNCNNNSFEIISNGLLYSCNSCGNLIVPKEPKKEEENEKK